MSESNNKDKWIEQYFAADTSQADKRLIVNRLDDEGRREVELLEVGKKSLLDEDVKALKNIVDEISAKKSFFDRRIMLLAASLVGIILVSIVALNYLSKGLPVEELADQYFEPYPDLLLKRGVEDSLLSKAMVSYNAGEYSKALEDFSNLEQIPDLALIYEGICLYKVGKLEKATQQFSQVQLQEGNLRTLSTWYLSLTYLKNSQVDLAIETLKEISGGEDLQGRNACELLDKLEE